MPASIASLLHSIHAPSQPQSPTSKQQHHHHHTSVHDSHAHPHARARASAQMTPAAIRIGDMRQDASYNSYNSYNGNDNNTDSITTTSTTPPPPPTTTFTPPLGVTTPTDATPTSASATAFATRKQWEAKLASLQRGMEHVQHCRAGDACGSSLCHSTRRLMQTYEKHQCPTTNAAPGADECKVCKLWGFLMARRTQMAAIAQLRRPLVAGARSGGGASCGLAALAAPRRRAASSVFSRVLAAQKEAVHLSARRRF